MFVVVQLLSHTQLLATTMGCSTPDSLIFHYLLEFVQVHVHWIGLGLGLVCLSLLLPNHLILWNPSSQFSSIQSLSRVRLFETPWIAARQASLSITNSWSLPKPMFIESVMPSNHLILCRPLLLLPPILPSIRVFSNKSTLRMRWPKYWNFCFSISPSNEHPGLISFRMDWLDYLAIQGTLKSLPQQHSSKASILQGWFPLGLTGLISLQSKGLSRVFSSTTFLKHQCFGTQSSLWSNSHIHTWLLEKS